MAFETKIPTTVLLADGRVLAIGGPTPAGSTEAIYDPATDRWERLAPMTEARDAPVALRIPDGRVVIGGGGRSGIDVFDPIRGTFTAVRGGIQAWSLTLLQNGKVLLLQFGYFACCAVDIFDPATGLISRSSLLASGTARTLPDGRLVVVDAYDVYIYTIVGDLFQLVAKQPLGGRLDDRAVAVLANGNVLIAGGDGDVSTYFRTEAGAYVYDPYHNTVKQIGSLPQAQIIRGMVNLADGSVVTTGGDTADYLAPEAPSDPLLYDPATGKFQLFPLPYGSSVVQLLDGRLLFVSGRSQVFAPTPRVVSSASLMGGVAAGSLAALFASQLAGIALEVVDSSGTVRPVRQIAGSSTRIDFLMPGDLTLGHVQVRQAGSDRVFAELDVNYVAPALYTREHDLAIGYFLRAEANGALTPFAIGGGLEMDERPLYLTLYGTGIRNRTTVGNVTCTIGGITVGVDYAGPDGGGVSGLDQVNVRIPEALRGRGIVDVSVKVDGVDSNTVTVEFH